MGFLCSGGIYFIKYMTIGHRDDGIGFICEGFIWYTTIGHGDDGIGFLYLLELSWAKGRRSWERSFLCRMRRGDHSGRLWVEVVDFFD